MSERLDKNPFYRTLVKEFSDIYCELNSNEWILCVPTVTCLRGVHIDRAFISLHILKPSLLLKCHYVPLISAEELDVEVDANTMRVTIVRNNDESRKEVVRIIGEEIAYNCFNKAYKIYIVSSPFTNNFKRVTETQGVTFNKFSLTSYSECKAYLNCLSVDITNEIKDKTKDLNNRYLILPNYLDDAAKRFQDVVDWGIKRYDELMKEATEEDDDLVAISVESFVIGTSYDKIFEAVKTRFAFDDNIFNKNCIELHTSKITAVDLGAQEVFKSVQLHKSFATDLSNLESDVTPLQKIYTLKKVVDTVNGALSEHIKNLCSPFHNSTPQVSVVCDDLVACVVYLLCEARVKNMVSNMSFIQFFGGHLSQKNEFGYSLVTFEVAVEFIKRFDKKSDNEIDSSQVSQRKDNRSECERYPNDTGGDTNVGSNSVSINSQLDFQLEKITRSFNVQKNVPTSAQRNPKNDEDDDLGDFLSSLSKKHYVVGAGKQTK